MIELPEKIEQAMTYLTRIPGVGEKTAFRYIMQIMNWSQEQREDFASSLGELSRIGHCQRCGAYSQKEICNLCLDSMRQETKTICVVEKFTDMMAIENSGRYQGLFHILGGVLNPLAGIGPDQLRIKALVESVKRFDQCNLILAINPSVEGDATCSYLKSLMPDSARLERIGFGVPIGGSLEYLDPMTISQALENKKVLL